MGTFGTKWRFAAMSTGMFVAMVACSTFAASVNEDEEPGKPGTLQSVQSETTSNTDLRDQNNNRVADSLDNAIAIGSDTAIANVKVLLHTSASKDGLTTAIGNFTSDYDFKYLNGFVANLNYGQIRALSAIPHVEWIEPTYQVTGAAESSRDETGVTALQSVPEIALAGLGTGNGVGVCVVDSGVHTTHEQFAVAGKFGGYLNAITDVEGDPTAVTDPADHGTMVASIIAGSGNGGAFAQALRGIAPEATLYVVKALGSDLTGLDSDVLKGMEWCIDQPGVDIINLSILGDAEAVIEPADAMTRLVAIASQKGVVVVAGAGNSEMHNTFAHTPGGAPLAISVGAYVGWAISDEARAATGGDFLRDLALDLSNLYGIRPAPFATRNPAKYGVKKPDISAPGHGITAASSANNAAYWTNSGTSFSTPMISGVVALMLQANPALTPDQVRNILYETAQDAGYLTNNDPAKDPEWGFGLVDAKLAVLRAGGFVETPADFHQHRIGDHVTVLRDQTTSFYFDVPVYYPDVLNIAVHSPRNGFLYNSCTLLGCSTQYLPDIDIKLYYDPIGGQEVYVGESICPAGGLDCAATGYQESIAVTDVDAGRYRVDLIWLPSSVLPSSYTEATIHYDVIWGPLITGNRAALINNAPVANAGADFTSNNTQVQLDGSLSSDADDGLKYFVWSWGADGFAEGMNPTIDLPDGETTEVTLTVTDTLGYSASDKISVTVDTNLSNQSPTANFAFIATDLTVSFTDLSSDADGQVTSWSWDFGDGNMSADQHPSHSYANPGDYTVTLTVMDDDNAVGGTSQQVSVTASANQAPTADAGADQTVQATGKGRDAVGMVTLDGSASSDPDGSVAVWRWTVDGQLITAFEGTTDVQLPKGTYTAELTVEDDQGLVSSNTDTVCIEVYNKNPSYTCSGGEPPPPPAGDFGTISGKAKDGRKNVGGVEITVTFQGTPAAEHSMTTANNGQFSFPNLPLGTWLLSGCGATPVEVELTSAGQTVSQDLACVLP